MERAREASGRRRALPTKRSLAITTTGEDVIPGSMGPRFEILIRDPRTSRIRESSVLVESEREFVWIASLIEAHGLYAIITSKLRSAHSLFIVPIGGTMVLQLLSSPDLPSMIGFDSLSRS